MQDMSYQEFGNKLGRHYPVSWSEGPLSNTALSHEELLDQFRTNFFGQINVTRAFLPHMRHRQSGTIVFMSSIAGWLGVAAGGPYSASKFALEGMALGALLYAHDAITNHLTMQER